MGRHKSRATTKREQRAEALLPVSVTCGDWGKHIFAGCTDRKWPYDGQRCLCGKTDWNWERVHREDRE